MAGAYAVPTLRITKVTCTQKHPLPGLFVLFRPAPPLVPERPKQSLSSWLYSYIAGDETSPAPPPPYQLGCTDLNGFLGPPVDQAVPRSLEEVPDTYKLMPGRPYDVYLIQHPSLARALVIAAEINAGSTAHGAPRSFTVRADEATIEVPEEPSGLLPVGSALYHGWNLYRDMAFGLCEPVKEQVRRLQAHLGALRYAVGTSNWPYLPDVGEDDDKSGGVNDGVFDVRVMNAVYRFQQDAFVRAFKVKGGPAGAHAALVDYGASFAPRVDRAGLSAMQARAKALKKAKAPAEERASLDARLKGERADVQNAESVANAWAYLDGAEVATPAARPDATDGVVNAATGKALQAWLEQGLRKPGAILVVITDPRGWALWMRPEAAQSWHAWNELVKALGFEHGVYVNHTFRSALVDIGKAAYGRSPRSIHKTGLAMDLGLEGDFVRSVSGWPVAYVREVVDSRVKWRLYGPARQTVPGALDARSLAAPIVERLRRLQTEQARSPVLASVLLGAISRLLAEVQTNPSAFFAKYYKATIERWVYDAWHPEGGVVGGATTASAFFAEHEPKDASRAGERDAFLDLTAVGELVSLRRIGSFKSGGGQTMATIKADKLTSLADALDAAAARRSHSDRITVARGKVTMSTTVSSLDAGFIRRWDATLKAAKKEAPKSVKTTSPQMTVSLSWSSAKIEDAKKVAAKLREHPDKLFYGFVSDDSQVPVQSAEAWASYIEQRPQQLQALAPTNQNLTQNTGVQVSSSRQGAGTWTVTLNPIFERGYAAPADPAGVPGSVKIMPGDVVALPAPGQPIGMEWWHFQRTDLLEPGGIRRLWGLFLIDIGWTRECLLDRTGPALYDRAGVGYPESELDKSAY